MGGVTRSAQAGQVQVAVASNFSGPFQAIAARFQADTGHRVVAIPGATGKFYSQIRAGAPFDVLLAADAETPRRLEDEGLAVKGRRFTYAQGHLVLWSAMPGLVDARGEVLRRGQFAHLAMANPKMAPYGVAAVQTLQALGLYEALLPRLVQGENIAQAHQFVATGNAELGLLARSQVIVPGQARVGSLWEVPASLHAPLVQDAALLNPGQANPAAGALLAYLRSGPALAVLREWGCAP